MTFAHDTADALRAAVRLVNSGEEPDTLLTLADLEEFFDDEGYTGRRPDETDLRAVRRLRPTLRRLLTSDRDAAVEIVNDLLQRAKALPRLVRHGDVDWHIHAIDDQAPLADRVTVETAMAMIDVIRADEMSRLAICAADDCEGIVLDLTRNRSKVFCSTTCGNGAAVAAYRARQAAAGATR
ncbi:CGNR zinc finger domain-containing protein [Calidifontibacter sp. DB0510]|uniref:CGNR zinc finger domain-containing protein n=1 Tax=Metallococcus carri TaxID=1656884 RepID=A0A967B2P7_9MICO|nr:CGNR zinc finger domain-containing protein [Metallococcus carri]NHN54552.1 CGNR zinc finger domain-containing protein [Metallococcus carri]NOP36609.1 CGNR zinc finger domain-containing protein [Calidifontibacter sp. DB2511S]